MPNISEIPLTFTVIAQILGNLTYILLIKKQKKGIRMGLFTMLFLLIHGVLLLATKNQDARYSILYLGMAILALYTYMRISCPLSRTTNAYCCIRGFILAEFAAAFEWLFYVWFARKTGIHSTFAEVSFMLLVYSVIYIGMFYLEQLVQYDYEQIPVPKKDFFYLLAFAISIFYLGNCVKVEGNVSYTTSLALYNTRALVAFGNVAILYAFHVVRAEMYMKNEVNVFQYMMQSQYKQYKQTREYSDLINIKYHDLKHQIALLKQESFSRDGMDCVRKLEKELKPFEAISQTGNEVLDVILTDKKRYCMEHEIAFTCVADGSLLHFIEAMDLCVILGNALDNAIECEEKITEEKKRIMHMLITEQKQFLLIKVENYCEQGLEFENGLPKTTKQNTNYHGYGMKSIKYTVEKYDGMLTTGIENHWFELKILIPLVK